MRRGIARQDVGEARVEKGFHRAPHGDKPRAAISGERGGVIEAAGVDVDAPGVVAPRARHGLSEEPAAVALPGISGNESDERQLAIAWRAAVEFEHPDGLIAIPHFEQLDVPMVEDRAQLAIAHDQAREPQPWRADRAEQVSIS